METIKFITKIDNVATIINYSDGANIEIKKIDDVYCEVQLSVFKDDNDKDKSKFLKIMFNIVEKLGTSNIELVS